MFRAGDETVAGADERARLWRDLASGLEGCYGGSAESLIAAAASRLDGDGGLIERLAEFEAYADPLAKKAYLFAKIAAAPRLARGRRSRELGGLRRQRADAAGAALGTGRAGSGGRACELRPAWP